MATVKATKATVVVTEPEEDDEIEALEEGTEEEAPAKKPRAKKAKVKKEEPEGYTTKEAGELLGIAPVKLRRILRTDDFTNDKEYTRYRLSDEDIERLRAAIAAGATAEKKPRVKKAAKAKKTQEAAEDVAAELEELDDLADDDAADIDLEDDDAEEEDTDLEDEDDDE